jgi:4-hydroxy-3-methylbut-2-enyl diphosphate reductase
MEEANRVCDFIRGSLNSKDLMAGFHPDAASPGFDPDKHLQRIGVANQTTMLATESLEIARLVGEALQDRHGDADSKDRFRSFDTICRATQDRQDAMEAMVRDKQLDLMVVIGGFNSSNTGHLLAMALKACPAWHIEDSSDLHSADELRHLPLGSKTPETGETWLPEGPVNIGLTAGASTPNRAIADTIARILTLRGIEPAEALAALPA